MKAISKLQEKLLYFSMLSFLLVGSTTLTLLKEETDIETEASITKTETSYYSPMPVLADKTSFPVLSAQGVIAIDTESSVVLYQKNPEMKLAPASTTKIMTALVALDYYFPYQVLQVNDVSVEGQKMDLETGEQITAEDLLYGLLVFSGNDAAEVLANNFPGGREAFMSTMNVYAKKYHMDNTHFENPSGLDGSDHYSTAKDMARLAEVAMRNDRFAEIVSTERLIVSSADGKTLHYLSNTNELLGEEEGVLGIKTGWTEKARENLVTLVERDGRRVLIALLGSQDRFGETKELINWIYENYEWQEISYQKEIVQE